MTASEVVLDSWAWWEIFFETTRGRRLARRFLRTRGVTVHTSALAVGELVAKLHEMGKGDRSASLVESIRLRSSLHDVTPEIAEVAGRLRSELRRREPEASLADAVMLATARSLGAKLVSTDAAFRGQPDVLR